MPETITCPYYTSGYCNFYMSSQTQYQQENYCVTPRDKENWQRCPNYQGVTPQQKIEKRVR